MIVGISPGDGPNPNEFGCGLDPKKDYQELPVFSKVPQGNVHASLDEEEGSNHGEGHDAQLPSKFSMFPKQAGKTKAEDEDRENGVTLAPFAQGHEHKQE